MFVYPCSNMRIFVILCLVGESTELIITIINLSEKGVLLKDISLAKKKQQDLLLISYPNKKNLSGMSTVIFLKRGCPVLLLFSHFFAMINLVSASSVGKIRLTPYCIFSSGRQEKLSLLICSPFCCMWKTRKCHNLFEM